MRKVVLITGVAGGIGSATAKIFNDNGWHVVGVDLNEPNDGSNIAHFIQGDVSDSLSSQEVFHEIANDETRLDSLINNAAIQICKPFIATSLEEWDRIMAFNVRSVYLMVHGAYPLMRANGGTIVNVSSVHAMATSSNIAAYAASKGAMLSLTRALAIELAKDNIRVNAVLPGAVDTPMLHAGLDRGCSPESKDIPSLLRQLGEKHLLGRIGSPKEIGTAIWFLANNLSSFVTGQSLVIDGGAIAKLSTE